MASFTEKSQNSFSGWKLQPQGLMAFGSRVARGICNGGKGPGGCFEGENQKKKVITNVPSKSLLGVRKKKGRVSLKKNRSAPQTGFILVRIIISLPPNSGEDQKKKIFAENWLCFSPEYRNFAAKFRWRPKENEKKKGLRRKSGLTLAGISDLLITSRFHNLILSNLKYCAWVL